MLIFVGFRDIMYAESLAMQAFVLRTTAPCAAALLNQVVKMPLQASIFTCDIMYAESLAMQAFVLRTTAPCAAAN